MFKSHNRAEKQFNITLKSPNGNTVGFINLSSQFLKAVIGKREDLITVADIDYVELVKDERIVIIKKVFEKNGIIFACCLMSL
jgi:hypothetical protein